MTKLTGRLWAPHVCAACVLYQEGTWKRTDSTKTQVVQTLADSEITRLYLLIIVSSAPSNPNISVVAFRFSKSRPFCWKVKGFCRGGSNSFRCPICAESAGSVSGGFCFATIHINPSTPRTTGSHSFQSKAMDSLPVGLHTNYPLSRASLSTNACVMCCCSQSAMWLCSNESNTWPSCGWKTEWGSEVGI